MAMRRGIALVLVLLVVAILISAGSMALLWAVASREPTITRNSTLVLQLDTDLRDSSPDDYMRQLFAGPAPASLSNVLEALRKAKVDSRVSAVVIACSVLAARGLWNISSPWTTGMKRNQVPIVSPSLMTSGTLRPHRPR